VELEVGSLGHQGWLRRMRWSIVKEEMEDMRRKGGDWL